MSVRQEIREYIVKNFYVPKPDELPDDASLLDQGIVDSTGVLEVISFLEQTFGITVDDTEMVPQNLESIAKMDAFVARKKSA